MKASAPITSVASFDRLYEALERSARRVLRGKGTLDAPALVGEAYLRLHHHGPWESTGHFFAVACRAMGQVVANHHRSRGRLRRGGGSPHVTICDDVVGRTMLSVTQFLDLQAALDQLERHTPRLASVVACRAIGGLSVDETAAALSVSSATVKRDWQMARAFLSRYLAEHSGDTMAGEPPAAEVG